ncbi:hypothetical protein TUM17571_17880 [Klebsiella pneumoniae]|nr:hypothetical protein NIHE141904_22250 [Enterobacter hormaechei]GJK34790.1 hypothetical protein TUM17557_17880 [Enterobacter cloacae]GJL07480.1 hypothetical protein TUM17571_17880 [Klebsiella pneumoniae]
MTFKKVRSGRYVGIHNGAVINLRQYRDDEHKPSQASACHFASIAPARRAVAGRMSASAT